MILQRLISNVRARDWGTVVVEVVVVVAGIFIGLQADDWNTARQDRKDERSFIAQLHDDIMLAEQLSERVRGRRLESLQLALGAGDVLFGRIDRQVLTDDECRALSGTSAVNIVVADLPSLGELIATGRLDILRDEELRGALLGFEQSKNGLRDLILQQTISSPDLVRLYPDLIEGSASFEPADNEVRGKYVCDSDGMRANRAFLNDFSRGINQYDAYVRDGLLPWNEQLTRVHSRVDVLLGESHTNDESR